MDELPISIVVPNLNQGRYLEGALRSLIDQGYANLEIIVMDGGSTDQSVQIIKRFEKHLTHWQSAPDNGQAAAINEGMALATGEVVNWLNADDRLMPGVLASVAQKVEQQPDAVAWTAGSIVVPPDEDTSARMDSFGLNIRSLAAWWPTGFIPQPACFFRRQAFESVGGVDESLDCAFDVDLWLKLVKVGRILGYSDEVWAKCIIHSRAKTQAKGGLSRAELHIVQIRHGFQDIALDQLSAELDNSFSWSALMGRDGDYARLLNEVRQDIFSSRLDIRIAFVRSLVFRLGRRFVEKAAYKFRKRSV